jgi:hypothetical protein
MRVLDTIFSEFQWYRRLRKGHWECWYIDYPVNSRLWLRNEHGKRPGLGLGTPLCEDMK